MKKCPYCGEMISDNSRFCLYCMKSLEEKEKIVTTQNKHKKLLLILASVSAVIFVSVIIIIVLLSSGKESSKQNKTGDTSVIGTNNDIIASTISGQNTNNTEETTDSDVIMTTTTPSQATNNQPDTTSNTDIPGNPTHSPFTTASPTQGGKPYDPTPENTNSADTESVVSISSATAKRGDTVTLNVDISNNPGLVTMSLKIAYDTEKLELIEVKDTGLLVGTLPNEKSGSPYIITWVDGETKTNNTKNGTIATLTFKIKNGSPSGITNISMYFLDSYNTDYGANMFNYASGTITIL